MNEEKSRQLSRELMEISEAAYLSTVDQNGRPQTRAMLNLRRKQQFPGLSDLFDKHRDDFLTYFTTNASSPKMGQIKRNPQASVYYCKPDEWRGLMLGGEIEIVIDKRLKEAIWQEGWEIYYPKGVHDPDHAILCFRPTVAKLYHQLNFAQFSI